MAFSGPAAARVPAGGMSAAAMNAMFNTYGDAGGHWTGGDGTASVTLPDGRIAWLFADTMLGTVNPDRSRPPNSPMVNNVIVVQDGTNLTTTLHGGTASAPEALVKPEQSGEHFWVMDGVVEGNTLKVLYNRIRTTGTGALDFEQTGVALATFALPALTLTSVVDLPLGPNISWGSGVFPDGAWTYIYGISAAPGRLKFAHLARVPAGGISGPWEYWTGSAWSTNLTDVGKLISGVDGGGVQKVGSQYVWVTHENNLVFDPQFVAYTSTSPTGPFTGPIPLFTAPEQQTPGLIVYDARVHPDLARTGKLLVSYNVNSLTPGGTTADVRHGRPRFVEVDWPRPAIAPGVPAAPAAPTVTAQNEQAQLTWTAVSGATGYRVYQRNVTGGQTHFARLPQTPTGTSLTAGFLVPGHTYEFKTTAVNANGEGPSSPVRTAAPHNTTPVADAIGNHGLATAVAGTYLVELEDTVPKAAVASYSRALATQYGGEVTGIMTSVLSGFTVLMTEAKAHDLALHPDVKYVQQDQTGRTLGTQNNPPNWGLDRIDQEPRTLNQRYVYPNLGSTDVYVVDNGVNIAHAEFGGRASFGYNDFQSEAHDACGNTHGTQVAGIAAGANYGVAKGARIISVKVVDCNDNSMVGRLVRGLEWIGNSATSPSVINISLGFWRENIHSPIDTAVRNLVAQGHVVVAGAGNTDEGAGAYTPARVAQAITVAASTRDDARWPYSSWGSSVDLFAPGANIPFLPGVALVSDSGTSFAAPHVAGAIAMIRTAHPGYGPDAVRQVLINATSKITITNGGNGSPNRLLFVEPAPPSVAPTGLIATARPDGTIDLSWNAVNDVKAHYVVYSRDVSAGEADLRQWQQPVFGTTAKLSETVEGHEYEFVVAAANGAGIGPQSAPARATADGQPPAPPTALSATAQADGTIRLSWTASAPGLWHYVYMRDLDAASGATNFERLPLPVAGGTTMTAGMLTHDHRYQFYVTAFDTFGESTPSNTAQATSTHPRPAPPTGLTATAGDQRVTLNWQSAGTGVWYAVEMRPAGGQWIRLALPITTCCIFVGTDLANGTTYEFRLVALGPEGSPDSLPSNVATATPRGTPPASATNLAATPGNGQVHLTWTPSSQPDAWYWVETRPAGGAWQRLEYPVTTCCAFTSTGLTNGTTYEYRLITIGAGGSPDSGPSNVASARPTAPPAGAPSNLRATAGNARVDLTWTASVQPGAWYWIEMRNASAGQAWQRLALPVTTCCTFASTGLTNGDTYEYRVITIGAAGGPDSAPSNVASARPTAPRPAPPTNLRATGGNARVDLTWTASTTAGAWYWLETRNVSTGQSWQRISAPITTCCSFPSTGLTNGNTYEYRLQAIGSGGAPDSAYSNVVSARPVAPQPAAPSNLTATPGDGKATLRWTASTTPGVWYWVYSRRAGTTTWQRNSTPVTTCCTHIAGFLTNGATYEFRVSAVGGGGAPDSGFTNIASARPMPPFPQPPANLSATLVSGGARLTWSASSTAGVVYNIYRRVRYPSGPGNWIKLDHPALGTSTTLGFMSYGYTYEHKVTAQNVAGESAPTNIASVLNVPSNRRCVTITSTWHHIPVGNQFVPIQRYDMTGSICGTRSNFSIDVEKAWSIAPNTYMLSAYMWYQVFDCYTHAEKHRYTQSWGQTPTMSWFNRHNVSIDPGRQYYLVVWGVGSVRSPQLIGTTFDRVAPAGIRPFYARTACF